MYVTVSVKIELNTRASLSDMERQIQQAGREGMKEGLKQAVRHIEAQEQTCPHCGSEQVQTQATKRRVLLTRFGRVEVPLRRLRCQSCGHRFLPAEHWLAEVKGHNVTADLPEVAALVGSSWPYETAASVLKHLSGVQLSDERLRRASQ
jgi:DNA-directed RNA polymerase subunit RPC12/RpoP